jgi:uncharacterized surface protein with fasciclin (FAS1) repeats
MLDAIKQYPDLVNALKGGKKNITLLVPNNDAFKGAGKLPDGDHLQHLLQYHALTEQIELKDGLNREIFMTWLSEPVLGAPQRVKILQKGKNFFVNDKVKVIEKNIIATNGILHVIDTVLVPPRDEFHRLAEEPLQASIFVDALVLTDLYETVAKQRLTIFVPLNEAFERLPKDERDRLFSEAGTANLTRILKRHIVPAVVYLGELEQSEIKLNTLEDGVTLLVQKRDSGGFYVNGVPVKTNDVFGKNGALNFVASIVPKKPKAEPAVNSALRKLLMFLKQWRHNPLGE